MSSFSLEDVRQQLLKLGYANVPDVVIDKFMARMKQKVAADEEQQKQQEEQEQEEEQEQQEQQGQQRSDSGSAGGYYAPASLPPPVVHTSHLASLPVSDPHYSSLAHPVDRHPTPSALPLPLSLRTNPAFVAQQAAYVPQPSFVQSTGADAAQQSSSSYQAYQAALAQQKQLQQQQQQRVPAAAPPASRVTVEDGDEDDEDEEAAYYRQKSREVEALEARLKRHAAVAHGTNLVGRGTGAAAQAQPQPAAPAPRPSAPSSHASDSFDDENDVDEPPRRFHSTQERDAPRSFGSVSRATNAPPSAAFALPTKHSSGATQGSASARTLHRSDFAHQQAALQQQQPRSILRPSSAQLRKTQTQAQPAQSIVSARPATAAPASRGHYSARHLSDDEEEGAVLQVEQIDTQRSLRKTYANSVQKFKHLNPRYGAGGYRKSDPVTRFHAFNSKWKSSAFLNKKTNMQQQAKQMQETWKA